MTIFDSAIDTKTTFLGMPTYTDILQPNCMRCFVLSGLHSKTHERSFTAFCKKTNKLAKIGPYKSYYEALKFLLLTKGCETCEYNKSPLKQAYLPILDEKIKEEIDALYGSKQELLIALNPIHRFAEYRNYLDINFKDAFGIRLFQTSPDDLVAGCDIVKPCKCQTDFALKIQALSGMIERLNTQELITLIKKRDLEKGSVNALEQFLKEQYSDIPRYIISSLRTLINLRNKMYPTHSTATELLLFLRNFGIDEYPLEDWEAGFTKIINRVANSIVGLNTLIINYKSEIT
jgi:hypothetical protein